jgi:hypothetical protein
MLHKKFSKCRQNINASSTIGFFLRIRADEVVFLQNLFCALAQFHFFEAFSEGQHCILFLCHWCNMMYDVMLCKMIFVPKTHIPIMKYTISLPFIFRLHRLFFGVSALTFRCKFCIPLRTSFELLRLLFRRYSRWLFALRLIFRRYLALHSLWNNFWAENLHCAPFGTTFCSFGKLTLCSLERLFVASATFLNFVSLWRRYISLWQERSYYKKWKMTRELSFQWLFLIKKENGNECKNYFRGRISLSRYASILAQYCWLYELRTPPWNLAADGSIGSLLVAGFVNT